MGQGGVPVVSPLFPEGSASESAPVINAPFGVTSGGPEPDPEVQTGESASAEEAGQGVPLRPIAAGP